MPGPWEIAALLLIVAIIFGVGRLAQVGGAVGKSVREFRGAAREEPAAPVPTTVSAPPVICPECGASNTGTNRFCSACGATIRPVAPVASGIEGATPSISAIAPSAAATHVADQPAAALAGGETPETATETAPIDAGRTANAPTTMSQNTCPSCATVNPPGQPFCGQCGTRLKPQAA